MMNDPTSYFEDTLIRVQFNNHPWTETFGESADYDKINLDRSYAIYREIFNNAYGMHFTFVGNIDPVKFKTFVEQYIASLPSKPKESHSKDVGLRPVRGIVEAKVKKGAAEDKKSMVKLLFAGETPYSYEAFLHQQALIDVINIIIIRELREEISGIYGGGMFGYLQKRPYQQYFISASFPCGPENTDKLTALLLGIIQRIKQNGCDQADLDKIKESWKNQRRERIRQNNYWARQLSYMRVNDEDPAVFLTHDSILEKISVTDIQTAARKYLDESNYIRGVLYPEK
jgi:zinc protease